MMEHQTSTEAKSRDRVERKKAPDPSSPKFKVAASELPDFEKNHTNFELGGGPGETRTIRGLFFARFLIGVMHT